MKTNKTFIVILITLSACHSPHNKHIVAYEYEFGKNTADTTDDRFEYILKELSDIDIPDNLNSNSNNITYYTYTSKTPVTDFRNVQWTKSEQKPEFEEEVQETELQIEVDDLDAGLQQSIEADPEGFGEASDADSGSDGSSSSDSGGDSGGDGGGDGGGGD